MSQLKFWNKQNSNSSSNKDKDKDSINDSSSNNSNNNNNSNNLNGNSSTNDAKKDKKNWLHTPEALMNGHVVYLVKFMGNLPVEQAKGIEVVKDAIRKLQFAQQMKKAETGTQEKFKKVEITISVDGVAIQEPRTQKILHQFPLHNISYCADEKGVKKFFSFIAKNVKSGVNGAMSATSNNSTGGSTASSSNSEDTHECFVFISNKLASDITLTIGQAFDLAYRKYMNTTEKNDLGKAQQKIIEMEKSITIYRNRLSELCLKLPKSELDAMLFKLGIQDITELPNLSVNNDNGSALTNGQSANDDKLLIDTVSVHSNNSAPAITSSSSAFVPMVPPRNNLPSQILNKSNSQKMDELLLNSDSDSDFDPRADEVLTDGAINKTDSNDIFGFEPTKNPYGQQLFFNNNDNKLQNKNSNNMNGMSGGGSGNQQQHTLVSHHSFTNELNITPPLLAPPPKAAATRRTISTSSNSNGLTNGNTDLFGSDPFDTSSTNIFKGKLSSVSVDDFSLESLDPLRK